MLLSEKIAALFVSAGIDPCYEEHGKIDDYDAGDGIVTYVTAKQIPKDIVARSVKDMIVGTTLITVMAPTAKGCINHYHKIVKLGYVNNEGNIGEPDSYPVVISGTNFWMYEPLDAVDEEAERQGNGYKKEFVIEFEFEGVL